MVYEPDHFNDYDYLRKDVTDLDFENITDAQLEVIIRDIENLKTYYNNNGVYIRDPSIEEIFDKNTDFIPTRANDLLRGLPRRFIVPSIDKYFIRKESIKRNIFKKLDVYNRELEYHKSIRKKGYRGPYDARPEEYDGNPLNDRSIPKEESKTIENVPDPEKTAPETGSESLTPVSRLSSSVPPLHPANADQSEALSPATDADRSSLLPPGTGSAPLARSAEQIIPTWSMIGEGAEGDAVAEIQSFLNQRGITGADGEASPVGGIFDPATRDAVVRFQDRHPTLLKDGVVGLRTLSEMLRDGTEPPVDDGDTKPGARAVRLAAEYGRQLALASERGGGIPDFKMSFLPSPETGTYDLDALEVATTLTVPHSVDRGLPSATVERDAELIFSATNALAWARAEEQRRAAFA